MRVSFLFVLFSAALMFTACKGDEKKASGSNRYAIIGKITGLDSGWVFLHHDQAAGRPDSTRIDRGYFTFAGEADSVEFCSLKIEHGGRISYREIFSWKKEEWPCSSISIRPN